MSKDNQKTAWTTITLSQWATVVAIVVAVVVASLGAFLRNVVLTAIAVGALGGLVHEVAQSNGTVVVPTTQKGDIYLGGLFGLIAGGIAGLLIAQGLPDSAPITNTWLSEFFLAGLALKGFSEAVSGKRPNPT